MNVNHIYQIFTNTFIKEAVHNKILAFIDKSKHALTATLCTDMSTERKKKV